MRILVPVDESLHSRRVIEFISHRETLLGTTPEIELVNVQYSVPETIIHLFGMEAMTAIAKKFGVHIPTYAVLTMSSARRLSAAAASPNASFTAISARRLPKKQRSLRPILS